MNQFSEYVEELAAQLLAKKWRLATAESCTGGLISAACTDLAGSSDWFECGFVTYSNLAKQQHLGVEADTLRQHGAVSLAVAEAMARGARARSNADVSVAVTGIAGPGGGSPDKPVGTVCLAWCTAEAVESTRVLFQGGRADVRNATAIAALEGLLQRI